jgi:hypothetical protein
LKKVDEIEKALKELLSIEAQAQDTLQRCYQARQLLGRFYAPAPARGKIVLSEKTKQEIIKKRREKIFKNSSKINS